MTLDTQRLQKTLHALLAPGRGILAADESSGTIKKRFASINLESTAESRRDYRDLLFTSQDYEEFISGVILYDETVDQKSRSGVPFSQLIAGRGVVPGIKTDEGKEEHPFWSPQTITRGLQGLGERLREYSERSQGTLGFTKWRQVILVDPRPCDAFLDYTMHVMAEQAAWSQEFGLVPICEPEILMTEIVTALEDEFDIEIEDEDAEKLTRVSDAVEYVDRKLGEKARKRAAK
ncbi:fructose-bisphosphate aldolase [Candidatus Peregrinibacteria bacterium]|nr:fructose-bisphosphate aldolase [Candidatus Peregrinibacteria bacterium]